MSEQHEPQPLWSDDRISKLAGHAPSAKEARRLHDAMRSMRDEYEAELTRMRGNFWTVADGVLSARAELRNRTIFIQCSEVPGLVHSYTLGDDEYLVRRVQEVNDGTAS